MIDLNQIKAAVEEQLHPVHSAGIDGNDGDTVKEAAVEAILKIITQVADHMYAVGMQSEKRAQRIRLGLNVPGDGA